MKVVVDHKIVRLLYREGVKNCDMPRRRPEFEPGEAGAEAAKLEKFSDTGGPQIQWLSDASLGAPDDASSLGKGVGRADFSITSGIAQDPSQILKNLAHSQIHFDWPSLLEYLGHGSLFSNLPPFDETRPLYTASISTLHESDEKEVLLYIFDHLFAENLNQIRSLPQINASFLLQAIYEQREKPNFLHFLSHTLDTYEKALKENPLNALHELILYLAWDRMCVCIGRLFSHPSTNPKFIQGVNLLREALLESYQHISKQEKTSPSTYRLIEALFFHALREENIQKHSTSAWTLLTQSFPALKGENELVDFFYIDHLNKSADRYLTLDPPDLVERRLALAQYILQQLKKEIPSWSVVLQPKNIIYL